jgi:glycosyltransferase involved in cell wall biosynthesis
MGLRLLKLQNKIDLFMSATLSQVEFLQKYLNLQQECICLFIEQPTDISFFTPGPPSQNKLRPVIGSGGLEKRDYRTLANATRNLNVDVKICAFSPNASLLRETFPENIPSNMSYGFYDWRELLQLYRDSDLVVITLFANNYQAGLSTLFEAMACRRPIIITRLPGIISDFIDLGIVTGVAPGDSVGLKVAIEMLLNNPNQAEAQAQKGYELVLKQYNHDMYVKSLVTKLTSRYGGSLREWATPTPQI